MRIDEYLPFAADLRNLTIHSEIYLDGTNKIL